MAEDDSIPDTVDWRWIARRLQLLDTMRDDFTVMAAILNRIDNTLSSLTAELRAMRSQHDRLRRRVEVLEEKAEH